MEISEVVELVVYWQEAVKVSPEAEGQVPLLPHPLPPTVPSESCCLTTKCP